MSLMVQGKGSLSVVPLALLECQKHKNQGIIRGPCSDNLLLGFEPLSQGEVSQIMIILRIAALIGNEN